MKLSDSLAIEVLRLERLAVHQRLSVVQMPSTKIALNGIDLGIGKLQQEARKALAEACERTLGAIDGELRGLGVEIAI